MKPGTAAWLRHHLRRVESILAELSDRPDPAFHTPRGSVSWGEWSAAVVRLGLVTGRLAAARLGWSSAPGLNPSPCCATLVSLDCHVFLLDDGLDEERVRELSRDHDLAAVIEPEQPGSVGLPGLGRVPALEQGDGNGEVTIFTSGSTGRPKAVRHDWSTLTRPVRGAGGSRRGTWLLTYRPHLYAGNPGVYPLSAQPGNLVLPEPGDGCRGTGRADEPHQVSRVSATPSYWRRLSPWARSRARDLADGADHPGWRTSDQPLLDGFKALFPEPVWFTSMRPASSAAASR